jgi:hypothetical protein
MQCMGVVLRFHRANRRIGIPKSGRARSCDAAPSDSGMLCPSPCSRPRPRLTIPMTQTTMW